MVKWLHSWLQTGFGHVPAPRRAPPDVGEFLSDALLWPTTKFCAALDRGMLDARAPRWWWPWCRRAAPSGFTAATRACTWCATPSRLLAHARATTPTVELRNWRSPRAGAVNRNVLFTCLGSPSKPLFDLSAPGAAGAGDRLLLCSDGLWGVWTTTPSPTGQQTVAQAVPSWWKRPAPTGAAATTSPSWPGWETPNWVCPIQPCGHCDSIDEVFASTIQAGSPRASIPWSMTWTTRPSERSIAEINTPFKRIRRLAKP